MSLNYFYEAKYHYIWSYSNSNQLCPYSVGLCNNTSKFGREMRKKKSRETKKENNNVAIFLGTVRVSTMSATLKQVVAWAHIYRVLICYRVAEDFDF